MVEGTARRNALAWQIRQFYELATRSIEIRLKRRLSDAGVEDLRPAHFRVFEYLPPEGARLTDLAERAQSTKQAMAYLVDQLEQRGYVERAPDPTDGRANIIRLSSRGRDLEKIAIATVAEKDAEWSASLGADRYKTLGTLLSDLNAVIAADLESQS